MRIWIGIAGIFFCAQVAHAGTAVSAYLKKDQGWFGGREAEKILENVLSHQARTGGWPKNTDTAGSRYRGKEEDLKGTFDNGATTDELRFLARVHESTKNDEALRGFKKGLKYLLGAQYFNGGWPQFDPPGKGYHRHITYNDGSMVRIMEFLREVATKKVFDFVDEGERAMCVWAFEQGVACILNCQVRVDGKLTVWCAQHDEVDFQPRPARSYELVSLSGSESVGIVRLLMSLEKPSPEVRAAIEGAVAWFEGARIKGIRVEGIDGDKVVLKDAKAPGLWARFYDVKTNKPMFCDRDGVVKGSLKEIGHERRNGYAWYGSWAEKLLEKEYPSWKERVGEE